MRRIFPALIFVSFLVLVFILTRDSNIDHPGPKPDDWNINEESFISETISRPPSFGDHEIYLPIAANGVGPNGKHGLAYGFRYLGATKDHPAILGVSHYHFWSIYPTQNVLYERPYIPFIWCANTPNSGASSLSFAKEHIHPDYDGLLYVGNEPDIKTQCLKYIDWDAGDCDNQPTAIHCQRNTPDADPNETMADLLFDVSEWFPNAKIIFPHIYSPHFPDGSEGDWTFLDTYNIYLSKYGEYMPIYGLGLHYGNIPYEIERVLGWIDDRGHDWHIVISEFAIKNQNETTQVRLWDWLIFMNNHPRVLCWQYYTNTIPFDNSDPTITTKGGELIYWNEDDSFTIAPLGETYIQFSESTIGQNQNSECLDVMTEHDWWIP